jgi:hypothetical protein
MVRGEKGRMGGALEMGTGRKRFTRKVDDGGPGICGWCSSHGCIGPRKGFLQ